MRGAPRGVRPTDLLALVSFDGTPPPGPGWRRLLGYGGHGEQILDGPVGRAAERRAHRPVAEPARRLRLDLVAAGHA